VPAVLEVDEAARRAKDAECKRNARAAEAAATLQAVRDRAAEEDAEGVTALANRLECVLSREELVRRRAALAHSLMDRASAVKALSAEERTIVGDGSAVMCPSSHQDKAHSLVRRFRRRYPLRG
jgi:hypothetical protein